MSPLPSASRSARARDSVQPPGRRLRGTPPSRGTGLSRRDPLRALRGRRRSRGQSIVEFAIVLPVLLFFLLIAVDFGRVFFTTIQLTNAAREAANYGATNPIDPQGMLLRANRERNSQVQGGQQNTLTYPDNLSTACNTPAGTSIDCGQTPGGGGAGNTLTVTLKVPFDFFTPLINSFFGSDFHITTGATVAVLNSAADPNATNPSGCSAPSVAKMTITTSGLDATIDPAGSLPESGLCAISGYNYDFGDGDSAVGGTVPTTHTYAHAGTYTVTLEVTNQGGSLTTTQTITVPASTPTGTPTSAPTGTPTSAPTATPCTKPVAQFAWSVTGGSGKATFTDQSSYPTGCPITTWLWDFGDGSAKSNAQNPQHTFAKNKQFTVTLTVTNSAGSTSVQHAVNS